MAEHSSRKKKRKHDKESTTCSSLPVSSSSTDNEIENSSSSSSSDDERRQNRRHKQRRRRDEEKYRRHSSNKHRDRKKSETKHRKKQNHSGSSNRRWKRERKSKYSDSDGSDSCSGPDSDDSLPTESPEDVVKRILQEFPAEAGHLEQLLHMIDDGQAVDIKGLSERFLVNHLRKLFLSLNLRETGDHVFLLPSKASPTLETVGPIIFFQMQLQREELHQNNEQSKPLDSCGRQGSYNGILSSPTEEATAHNANLSLQNEDATACNANLCLPAEEGMGTKRRVIGPVITSVELLAAAAKLTEAEAELRNADLEEDTESFIGLPPPALVTEAELANEAERFEEVTRIMGAGADNSYGVLGVNRNMSSDNIKKGYWTLALMLHPDKCSHPEAHQAFIKLNKAFKNLQNPDKRKVLDEKIKQKEEQEEHKADLPATHFETAKSRRQQECVENIPIWIQHSGVWQSDHSFVNFSVDGILISPEFRFEDLVSVIAKQLGKDTDTNLMDIKYKVKDKYPPITVWNDMSVRFYVELKKRNSDFTQYPLCITFKDKRTAGSCSNANTVATSSDGTQSVNIPDVDQNDTIELISDGHEEDYNGIQDDDKGIINTPPHQDVEGKLYQDKETIELISSGHEEDYNIIQEDVKGIINNPLHQDVEEGQLYWDKETLYSVMKHYAIRKKFQFRVERSSSNRYCLGCLDKDCSWSFKSSSLNKTTLFKVRKFNDVHTCSREESLFIRRHTTSEVIGSMIKDKYANSLSVYTPTDIMRDMKRDYGVDLSYMKAWRAKEKALELVRGNLSDSYVKLPSYLYMLMHANPGSVVRLHKSENGSFLYVFVSLDASIKGWEYCKPVVVVDGCFLRSAHKGMLITACTEDASGEIFPLAYSVVDLENDASWEWFFERFRDTYGAREGMCIVSNMHESTVKAASIVYPEVPHCVSMFHLWNNIEVRYKKNHKHIKELFYASARAYTVEAFEKYMAEIDKVDDRVREYLFNVGYDKWSRAHFVVNRTTTMTSNIVELMNATNKHARDLPILPLLEYMMSLVQKWNYANRKSAVETFTKLGKKYEAIMKENYITSQRMTVKPSDDYLYTVVEDGRLFVVNMTDKTCTCKRFETEEMPCPHALAVATYDSMDAYEYCSIYYSKDYLMKTYECLVYPLPEESTWNIPREILEDAVLPPTGKVKAGRPKKLRIKSSWEKHNKLSCGLCGQLGHNRKTCKNPLEII